MIPSAVVTKIHSLRAGQHLSGIRPLVRTRLDARFNELPELLAVLRGRNRGVFAPLDLLAQGEEVHLFPVEWGLKGRHFVQEATQGPNVGLEVVARLFEPFRAHVVGRSDEGVSRNGLGAEEATQAQIPQLDHPTGRQEHVGGLDVSVHDPLAMHVVQRTTKLDEEAPNGLFGQQLVTTLASA